MDELVREDNEVLDKTIVYSYDVGGNILNKVEYPYTTGDLGTATKTYDYTYWDSNWKDKLTEFDGKKITYDEIGNPLTYNGWNYTWEEGRQLKSMGNDSTSVSFKYNDEGIRTEKTVDGITTSYRLVDDRVTYETDGTDEIYYTYDSDEKLISMNLNGTEYYYVRNAQEDIIGLIDNTGAEVVNYTYDSWGRLISTTGSLKDTVGLKNPYRYRGYRYDEETGLYYLQSRYYNSEIGRFINLDDVFGSQSIILSHNLFTYCLNNPIINVDEEGHCAYLGVYIIPGIGEVALVVTGAIIIAGVAIWSASWLFKKIKKWIKKYGKAQIRKVRASIPNKLKKNSTHVDLSKFNVKLPNGNKRGLGGWYISKDTAWHGGRAWKLFNKAGKRIASLSSLGKILGK